LDPRDGLGALRHYPFIIGGALADLERLPFPDDTFDAAVFGASLHYAPNPIATLREALRILRPAGRAFVMDSPIYRRAESGEAMVAEMRERLGGALGLTEWIQPAKGYFTDGEIAAW